MIDKNKKFLYELVPGDLLEFNLKNISNVLFLRKENCIKHITKDVDFYVLQTFEEFDKFLFYDINNKKTFILTPKDFSYLMLEKLLVVKKIASKNL